MFRVQRIFIFFRGKTSVVFVFFSALYISTTQSIKQILLIRQQVHKYIVSACFRPRVTYITAQNIWSWYEFRIKAKMPCGFNLKKTDCSCTIPGSDVLILINSTSQ